MYGEEEKTPDRILNNKRVFSFHTPHPPPPRFMQQWGGGEHSQPRHNDRGKRSCHKGILLSRHDWMDTGMAVIVYLHWTEVTNAKRPVLRGLPPHAGLCPTCPSLAPVMELVPRHQPDTPPEHQRREGDRRPT